MGSGNIANFFGNIGKNNLLPSGNFEPYQPDIRSNDALALQNAKESAEVGINNALKEAHLRSLNMPFIGIAKMLFQQSPWRLDGLDERRKNLLKLPQIAKNEAALTNNPDMKIAWDILAECFYLYFSEQAIYNEHTNEWLPNPNVYKVDWEFATSPDYIQSLISNLKDNLLNDPAKRKIEEKLMRDYKKLTERKYFDFTATPEIEWDKNSYQQRSVKHIRYSDPIFTYKSLNVPQYRALGDFNISALSKGYVEPAPDGGDNICVSDVYLFVNDHFNFEGASPLGIWDFKNMRYIDNFNAMDNYLIYDIGLPNERSDNKYMLYSSDFNNFRKNTGYGRNFRIVSPLQKVNEFKPYCWKAQW